VMRLSTLICAVGYFINVLQEGDPKCSLQETTDQQRLSRSCPPGISMSLVPQFSTDRREREPEPSQIDGGSTLRGVR
jgi:hypothetical protein